MKWGKEKFEGVELNTDEPPMVFKAQLFALTGVQPARQKVMVKGGTLKDDDWGNIKMKNVSIILRILIVMQFPNYYTKLFLMLFFFRSIQLFQHHMLKTFSFSH